MSGAQSRRMAEPRRVRDSERRRLVERQAPAVRKMAQKMKRRVGPLSELADLVGYGAQGLVEAAHRFRADGEQPFAKYMSYRVRGAMIDAVRASVGAAALVEPEQGTDECT